MSFRGSVPAILADAELANLSAASGVAYGKLEASESGQVGPQFGPQISVIGSAQLAQGRGQSGGLLINLPDSYTPTFEYFV